jgi:hypothetical protein
VPAVRERPQPLSTDAPQPLAAAGV